MVTSCPANIGKEGAQLAVANGNYHLELPLNDPIIASFIQSPADILITYHCNDMKNCINTALSV